MKATPDKAFGAVSGLSPARSGGILPAAPSLTQF
jgi:hypothetical protein